MRWILRHIRAIIYGVITLITLAVACSCATKYIPVETTKSDSIYITQVERDSIYIKDSVYVRTVADTVFHTRVQWQFRDRVVRDTVRIAKRDTISCVVEVEKELTAWQRSKMSVGGYAIVCSAILVAIWFAKRLKGL